MVESAAADKTGSVPTEEVLLAAKKPTILEKRIIYRHGLTTGVVKPPQGAILLTRVQQKGKKANGNGPSITIVKDPTRPQPGTELCDETEVDALMEWKNVKGADTGLRNTSVTCYINATLQCLIYTPPLSNYLSGYKTSHRGAGVDWLEMVSSVTKFSISPPKPRSVHNPIEFSKNLRRLSTTLRRGRLEDAQEFLSFLIDACHMYQLSKYTDVKDPLVQETTPIKAIFGGFFKSAIQWSKAEEIAELKKKSAKSKKPVSQDAMAAQPQSATYEPFTCLTLEIQGQSVQKSLQHFAKPEQLTGDNKYITPSGVKVNAQKSFTVFRCPRILIVHLKRFVSNMWGDTKKINKFTEFPTDLDMKNYTSGPVSHSYKLYGVVVHQGGGTESGHYISFITAPNGAWYRMDDETVTQVSLNSVLKQQAYILFYTRVGTTGGEKKPTPSSSPSPSAPPSGPVSSRQKKFEEKRRELEKAEHAKQQERDEIEAKKKAEEEEENNRKRKLEAVVPEQRPPKAKKRKIVRKLVAIEENTTKKVPKKKPVVRVQTEKVESAHPPAKKQKVKTSKKSRYESAALNAQSAFEMPKDTEAYWKDRLEEDTQQKIMVQSLEEDEQGVVVDEEMQKFGEKLLTSTAREDAAAVAESAEKPSKNKRKRQELSGEETPLEKAKKELAPIKAAAMLEARSKSSTLAWNGVDQTGRNNLTKQKKSKAMAKLIAEREWNRTLDQGKQKKLPKSQRISKGHASGHTTFQEGFNRKQDEQQKEKDEMAAGTWVPTEASDRSKKKLSMKKRGEEFFS